MGHPGQKEGPEGAQLELPSRIRDSTTSTAGPIPYRPLRGSEIRLLRIAPGAWDDQVSCTMQYAPLDEQPEYVALSYTWGDASDQVDILLDGRPHRATQCLFTALRRFRQLCAESRSLDGFTFSSSADGCPYIWADALCINQADDREKEREIPRMREVYTLCSRVCVWLGENDEFDDDESRAVLGEIERWLESGSFGADIPRDVPVLTDEESLPLQREVENHFGPRVAAVLDIWCSLAEQDWFGRAWVVQEVALPATEPIIMAGGYLFGFERFTRIWRVMAGVLLARDATAFTSDLGHHGALYRTRIHAQDHPVRTDGEPGDRSVRFGRALLEAMVRQGPAGLQATTPHDYLYSMIGLCGGGELLPPELAPDYQKLFPLVCEDYARCIIKATGSVAILGRGHRRLHSDYHAALRSSDLPWWVPDFRTPSIHMSVKGDMDPSAVSFVGPDERYLKVRGFVVGKVTRVYRPLKVEEDGDISFSERLRHHHKFLVQISRERNIRPEEAVANWLTTRILAEHAWTTKPAVEDLQAFYDHYLQQDDNDDDSRADSLQDNIAAKKFVQLTRERICNKYAVLCEGGVDADVHSIDIEAPLRGHFLVALSGCRWPFLARQVMIAEGDAYVVLSPCMSFTGDQFEDYLAGDFSLEHFDESEFEDFILV